MAMRRLWLKLFVSLTALASAALFTSCGHHCNDCGTESAQHAPYKTGDVVISNSDAAPPPVSVPAKVITTKPVDAPAVDTKRVDAPVETPANPGARKTIRIKAGGDRNWKDKNGNIWRADSGFTEGAMVDLGKIKVENTDNPEIYTSEHNNMEKFTWPVPNGKYTVKLHFIENPDDVKKAGERVFTIDVLGEKLKDLDIFSEAGGANKALVKSVNVNVTGGKIEILFKAEQKEPVINGIEIVPE